MKLISIVTPVFNEEENINYYYETVTSAIVSLEKSYNFEFIITDNNSSDKTLELLRKISSKDKRLKIFKLSKNYGYQKSLWTGICQSNGDAVIPMDCDLQDPPELIKEFIKHWEDKNKIVYGIRDSRKEKFLETKKVVDFPMFRNIFYYILNKISDDKIPKNVGDFMLIDKVIVNHIKEISDHNIYLRGIIFSLGYKKKSINYHREKRKGLVTSQICCIRWFAKGLCKKFVYR